MAYRQHFMIGIPIAVIGTLLSVLAFLFVDDAVEHDGRDELRAQAFEKMLQIERTIRADIASLNAVRGLFAAAEHVNRAEFHRFRQSIDLAPSIRALDWAPRIAGAERRSFEDAARRGGSPRFQIWEPGEDGQPVAAPDRAEFFPVLYSDQRTPVGGSVFGLNVTVHYLRAAAVEAARMSGRTVATPPVELMYPEGKAEAGFLVIVPVYEGGQRPSVVNRLARTKGVIIGEFAVSQFMREALGDLADRSHRLNVRISDRTDEADVRPVFQSGRPDHAEGTSAEGEKEVVARRLIEFAGRNWDVIVTLDRPFDRFGSWPPWITLMVGLAITAALVLFLHLIQSRREFAEQLATKRTEEVAGVARRLRTEIARGSSIERELVKSRERVRDAIECLDDGFALFDAEHRLVLWNGKYLDFDRTIADSFEVGVSFQELAQAGAEVEQWMDAPHPNSAAPEALIVPSVRERQLRDGRWLLVKLQSTAEGGLVDIRTDITDLKVRTMELEDHRDRLEELAAERTRDLEEQAFHLREALTKEREYNALQAEFVSMVSHEFRTPLAIVDGAAQLIERKAAQLAPDDLVGRVGKIRRAVRRLVILIESTLSLSRIEAGKMEARLSEVDLRLLVIELCEQQQQISTHHGIAWQLDALPDRVVVDPDLMRQVVSNLLSNAAKYSPQADRIEVAARTTSDVIAISVRDFGLGIPEADLPRLFDRFFRASNVTGIAGTGIGLNLCRSMVQLHGGTLDVVSKEGEGSLFTLRLPVSAASTAGVAHSQAAAS